MANSADPACVPVFCYTVLKIQHIIHNYCCCCCCCFCFNFCFLFSSFFCGLHSTTYFVDNQIQSILEHRSTVFWGELLTQWYTGLGSYNHRLLHTHLERGWYFCIFYITCADPEGGQGVRTPPLENYKNIGFLSNTGLDPLKSYKTTNPAFNVGPPSARQRNAI